MAMLDNDHSVKIAELDGLGGNYGRGYIVASGGIAVLNVLQINAPAGSKNHGMLPVGFEPKQGVAGVSYGGAVAYGYAYSAGDATTQGQISVSTAGEWSTWVNKATNYLVGQVVYLLADPD